MAFAFIRLTDKAKEEFIQAIEIMNFNNGTRYTQQDIAEMLIRKWTKKYLRNQPNEASYGMLSEDSQKIIKKYNKEKYGAEQTKP